MRGPLPGESARSVGAPGTRRPSEVAGVLFRVHGRTKLRRRWVVDEVARRRGLRVGQAFEGGKLLVRVSRWGVLLPAVLMTA